MLLTRGARAVKSVTATLEEADAAGLRIASAAPGPDGPGELQVTTAPGPGENDQVIETGGARIYLEPQAAAFLDDKILDAARRAGEGPVLPGHAGHRPGVPAARRPARLAVNG